MGIIQTMLRQEATYWPPNGIDEYGANIAGTPEVVRVRWEDSTEEFMDGEGKKQISNAFVYVEKDLEMGGWLYLGRHADLPPESLAPEYIGFGVNLRKNPNYITPEAIKAEVNRPTKYGKSHMGLRTSREVRRKLRNVPPNKVGKQIVGGAQAPGTVTEDIYQIAKFEKTPNLKATQTLRVAIL